MSKKQSLAGIKRWSNPQERLKQSKRFKGKNGNNYIDGRSCNPNYCVNCGKLIGYTAKRCRSCFLVFAKNNPERERKRRKRISKSMKGVNTWMKGKKHSKETIEKMKSVRTGKTYEEIYGKERAKLVRKRISKSNKELARRLGLLLSNKDSEYPVEFNCKLKEQIRKLNNNICFLCGDKSNEEKLSVHHINYDKENCSIDNLVALCRSCHMRIHNYNKFFRNHGFEYHVVK